MKASTAADDVERLQIQIGPAALDLHIRFVHPPRAVGRPQMRPDALLKPGCISLDPAENRRVVDRDAAVLQHEREIAVADREHQIPAHRPEDYISSELPALE